MTGTHKGAVVRAEQRQRTLEALHAVQLREQLVDDTVRDAGAVVPPLRRNGVELVEKEHARRRRRRSPAISHTLPRA